MFVRPIQSNPKILIALTFYSFFFLSKKEQRDYIDGKLDLGSIITFKNKDLGSIIWLQVLYVNVIKLKCLQESSQIL